MSGNSDSTYHLFSMSVAGDILFKLALGLSVTGILFVCITSLAFKTYRRPLGLMVLMIAIADLLFTFPLSVFFKTKTDVLCNVAAAVSEYGAVSSLLWVGCFAHALKNILSKGNEIVLKQWLLWYFIISQVVPIGFAAYSYLGNFFKANKSSQTDFTFCFHPESNGFDFVFLICLPLPALLTACYIAYCYFMVGRAMKGLFRSKSKFISLMLFPLVLVVSWAPLLIYQFMVFFNNDLKNNTVSLVLFSLAMLQGFFNAIAYGVSHRLISRVKESCCFNFLFKRDRANSRAQTKSNIFNGFEDLAKKNDPNDDILQKDTRAVTETMLPEASQVQTPLINKL